MMSSSVWTRSVQNAVKSWFPRRGFAHTAARIFKVCCSSLRKPHPLFRKMYPKCISLKARYPNLMLPHRRYRRSSPPKRNWKFRRLSPQKWKLPKLLVITIPWRWPLAKIRLTISQNLKDPSRGKEPLQLGRISVRAGVLLLSQERRSV